MMPPSATDGANQETVMSRATWVDEYLRMVDDCEKRESKLTEWESIFVDSIRSRLEKEQPLSAKQTEMLDKIWQRVVASPYIPRR